MVREADLAEAGLAPVPERAAINGLGGVPAPTGLGSVHEVDIAVRGTPDRRTGYVVGIHELDSLVRRTLGPRMQQAFRSTSPQHPAALLAACGPMVATGLPAGLSLHALTWRPSAFLAIEWTPTMPTTALLSERFEFAASHRLHCPELSDADNRRIFGKCNNANGHGHNYRIEVSVRVPVPTVTRAAGGGPGDGSAHAGLTLPVLEGIVARTVIDRFDHRNLNMDVAEFRDTVPSVENIAAACHALLELPVREAGGTLARVTVWETDKTSASYPAPE
jgi:6-pyruvoyltetrahydropterin/6-carboxytetrahydropterin synthase